MGTIVPNNVWPTTLPQSELVEYCLQMSAAVLRVDLHPLEVAYWVAKLSHYPADKIRKAFDRWLESEIFMPKPAEIIGLIKLITDSEKPVLYAIDKLRADRDRDRKLAVERFGENAEEK